MYDNRTKIIIILFLLTLIFSLFTVFIYSKEELSLSARSAVLYEPETESFLYEKNANERLGMASTTKIMTALLALELLELDDIVEVDKRAVGVEGSSVYLKEGERMDVRSLIYAVLLQSANDAAAALAYEISGGIDEFASLMNERASLLGLRDTSFKNPHGLDDKEHYTTAHDLALISAEALKNPEFKEISSSYKMKITSSASTRVVVNHNKMLKRYDGCIGVKTGYTEKCGRCLVSAAERDGLTMIAVTIKASDDWNDHKKLLDLGYTLLEKKTLADIGEFSYELPIIGTAQDKIKISNIEKAEAIFKKGYTDYETHIRLTRTHTAPITKGDILGSVIFTKDGETIAYINLTAETTVEAEKPKKKGFLIWK